MRAGTFRLYGGILIALLSAGYLAVVVPETEVAIAPLIEAN